MNANKRKGLELVCRRHTSNAFAFYCAFAFVFLFLHNIIDTVSLLFSQCHSASVPKLLAVNSTYMNKIYAIVLREVGQTIAVLITLVLSQRGKSGLHRAECQVTPGGREPTASAAERKPPRFAGVRVKWCGKSAPRSW